MRALACAVSWETAEHLPHCLRALTSQTHADLEVVVVDNASRDGSADVARMVDGVRVVANPGNVGFAAAANQGVELAHRLGAEALVVCNPDATPEPDYVERALAALQAAPRRAAVQGRLWRSGGVGGRGGAGEAARTLDTTGHLAFTTRLFRNRGEGEPDDGRFDEAGPVFGVSGALATYRVAALDDVAVDGRVFDEALFAFWEDVDLDWRLALRGWDAWYTPDATAWHERGGAGPRRSAVVERLNFINRLLVVAKNDAPAALARALPGVVLTTGLKAVEMTLTVPRALVGLPSGAVRGLRTALTARRVVQDRSLVDPAAVVDRWFAPFDYATWVRTWWRRVGPSAP